MSTGGWITFLTVTGGVSLFFIYSMSRVIHAKKPKKVHSVYDVKVDK